MLYFRSVLCIFIIAANFNSNQKAYCLINGEVIHTGINYEDNMQYIINWFLYGKIFQTLSTFACISTLESNQNSRYFAGDIVNALHNLCIYIQF